MRFRFLDANLRDQTRWPVMDCTISVHDLASLSWRIPRVLVVENKPVFCLPDVPNTLAILHRKGRAASFFSGYKNQISSIGEIVMKLDRNPIVSAGQPTTSAKYPHGRSNLAVPGADLLYQVEVIRARDSITSQQVRRRL